MRSSKAQVQSQIFMYVLTVMIAGMLLLFGYKAVDKFTEDAGFAAELQFQNNVKKLFSRIDYRSELVEELLLPDDYNEICFLRMQKDGTGDEFPGGEPKVAVGNLNPPVLDAEIIRGYPVIESHRMSHARRNAFLIDKSLKIATVALDVGYTLTLGGGDDKLVCFKSSNQKIALKLFGCGKRGVLIAPTNQPVARSDCTASTV